MSIPRNYAKCDADRPSRKTIPVVFTPEEAAAIHAAAAEDARAASPFIRRAILALPAVARRLPATVAL